ncbi:MAG: hypothetical protein R6V12_20510 [Candidatus Hydrogenedentota bacterium]
MPLSKCPRCSRMFNKQTEMVCPLCQPDEDADYESVRQALAEHPNLTAQELTELTGVELSCILRLLGAGRIASLADLENKAVCGRCGAPAISLSKRLCKACLEELNAEVAKAQASIKLERKKEIKLGKGMNFRKWSEGE